MENIIAEQERAVSDRVEAVTALCVLAETLDSAPSDLLGLLAALCELQSQLHSVFKCVTREAWVIGQDADVVARAMRLNVNDVLSRYPAS